MAVIDDIHTLVRMLAAPLQERGHRVHDQTVPIDFERIMKFGPEVVIIGLARKAEAENRPIRGVEDLVGYQALVDVDAYPAINVLPVMLVGIGLREDDLPIRIPYDLFLALPDDADLLAEKAEELATRVKTRRRISGYRCFFCGSRLVFVKNPADLFCPRCHAAVAVVDEGHALVMGPEDTVSCPVKIVELERGTGGLVVKGFVLPEVR